MFPRTPPQRPPQLHSTGGLSASRRYHPQTPPPWARPSLCGTSSWACLTASRPIGPEGTPSTHQLDRSGIFYIRLENAGGSLSTTAGVTGGKTVTRDVPRFSARFWIASTRRLFTAVWWLSCEQYGVVWRMMVALLVVSGSLDGSVAGCERVLDVSVSLDVDVVVVVKQ